LSCSFAKRVAGCSWAAAVTGIDYSSGDAPDLGLARVQHY
jgi:hypothetical protein